jgi:hypothetical protein
VKNVAAKQQHLNTKQQAEILVALKQNEKLIDDSLNMYPHCKVHIDI